MLRYWHLTPLRERKLFAGEIFAQNHKMPERCIILIDGSNFYFKLREIGHHSLLDFDFRAFANHLKGSNTLQKAIYYVGAVKQDGTTKINRLHADQQKLLAKIRIDGFRYKLGFLLKSNNVFHEMGVDVQLAVDMLEASYEDLCDRIILVSSDTDLTPAVKKVVSKGKVVEYVGFAHKPSVAMMNCCSSSRLLTRTEIGLFSTTP